MKNILPKIVGFPLFLVLGLVLGFILRGCDLKTFITQETKPTVVQTQPPKETILPTIPPTATPTISTTSASLFTTTPIPTKQPDTELLFNNYNTAGVRSGPTAHTTFTLKTARKIYLIQDYHWNSAKGKTPGTIGLESDSGTIYGPWKAKGSPGQGGVPDAYWTVYPDTEIPAGTYTIIDSDPGSWAQNAGTKGLGMSQVYAVK